MPYFINSQGIVHEAMPPRPETAPLPPLHLPEAGVGRSSIHFRLPKPIKRLLILGAEVMIGFMITAMITGMGVGIIQKLQQESSHTCTK